MFMKFDVISMAGALARHATQQQAVAAENIAHADTPGYRAKRIGSFADSFQAADNSSLKNTRAGHIAGQDSVAVRASYTDQLDATSPNGNSVSLETEMMKSAEAAHQHELALSVYKSSMNILRSAMGRR